MEDTRVGGTDNQREKDFKCKIIAAFERIMNEPPDEELTTLWQSVQENEVDLEKKLKRRIWGPLFDATPCPFCGAILRTRNARQCRKCLRDWHDPD